MERSETIGLGIAAIGHIALIGALSFGLIGKPDERFKPKSVDVQLVSEVGLEDQAPDPSLIDPATSIAPEMGPPEEAAEEPVEEVAQAKPEPKPKPAEPVATIAPKPTPRKAKPKPAKAKPKPKPKPKKPAKSKPRGSRLGKDLLKGISDQTSLSKSQKPTAAKAGPAVIASLQRELLRQLKPHWQAPTGADSSLLRTELSISLDEDGYVIGTPRVLRTTGINASNRPQARLHAERAVKAVRRASPFNFPPKYYDTWKLLEPVGFDKRLSQ